MTLTKAKPVRRPTNHHKRSAQHHKQSGHYLKAYWPYLPIFAVLGLGIFFNSFLARSQHGVLGYATNVSSQVLLAETNGERTANHEAALQINQQLASAAQAKANDMAKRDYWSHVTPDGKQPWTFIDAAGYHYTAAGENLAYGFGTSDEVLTAWMHSPEHRANILNGNYQDVGFATANVANYQGSGPETIVVAIYATPYTGVNVSATVNNPPVQTSTTIQPVSRLQLITTATWLEVLMAAICGAAITLYFVRHALAWHKVLVRGENFVVHHPFFDVFLMSAAVLGFILSHAAGIIL